jgi:hypothetical protein
VEVRRGTRGRETELADIGASRKDATRSGEHDALDGVIRSGAIERLGQLAAYGMPQAVDRRVAELDHGDGAVEPVFHVAHIGISSLQELHRAGAAKHDFA